MTVDELKIRTISDNMKKQIIQDERERCGDIVKSYSSIVGSFIDPINILVKTLINEIEKSIRDQG